MDSINADIEKEISLTKIQLDAVANTKKLFETGKTRIFNELTTAEYNLSSQDLAVKEKAFEEFPQLQRAYSSFQEPAETTQRILIRVLSMAATRTNYHQKIPFWLLCVYLSQQKNKEISN